MQPDDRMAVGWALFVGGAALIAMGLDRTRRTPDGTLRAVVHLNAPEAHAGTAAMRAVRSMLEEQGNRPADIVVAAHGEAVAHFLKRNAEVLGRDAEALSRTDRVRFMVCRTTLTGRGWTERDVLPFASVVPSVPHEVVLLQRRGYAYFKP